MVQHSEAATHQAADSSKHSATTDGQPSADELASPQPAVQLPATASPHSLSLAKLATSGLLLLQLHNMVSSTGGTQQADTVQTLPVKVLRLILQDLQAGRLAAPE